MGPGQVGPADEVHALAGGAEREGAGEDRVVVEHEDAVPGHQDVVEDQQAVAFFELAG